MINYYDAEQYQIVSQGERLGYIYKRFGPNDGKAAWDRMVEVCWLDPDSNHWLPPRLVDRLTLDPPTEELLAMRALAGLSMPGLEYREF